MKIDIHFSDKEKKDFLMKQGYILTPYEYSYWEQWGNHDNQGDYKMRTIICAVKNIRTLSEDLEYNNVFKVLMEAKIKSQLLK